MYFNIFISTNKRDAKILGEDARETKKREILQFVFMPAYDVCYSCYYCRDDVAATVIVRVDVCQKISRDL